MQDLTPGSDASMQDLTPKTLGSYDRMWPQGHIAIASRFIIVSILALTACSVAIPAEFIARCHEQNGFRVYSTKSTARVFHIEHEEGCGNLCQSLLADLGADAVQSHVRTQHSPLAEKPGIYEYSLADIGDSNCDLFENHLKTAYGIRPRKYSQSCISVREVSKLSADVVMRDMASNSVTVPGGVINIGGWQFVDATTGNLLADYVLKGFRPSDGENITCPKPFAPISLPSLETRKH